MTRKRKRRSSVVEIGNGPARIKIYTMIRRDGYPEFTLSWKEAGRSAPAQQSDPPAIHLGDIPELLANQGVALELVMLFHQLAETLTQQGVGGCASR